MATDFSDFRTVCATIFGAFSGIIVRRQGVKNRGYCYFFSGGGRIWCVTGKNIVRIYIQKTTIRVT